MTLTCEPIGTIHSCFKEKFGIPRQPGLVPEATASLEIHSPYDREEAFRGLERFSHIWVLFIFHGLARGSWRPTVRPPRLGGNERIGVFATRSGFRPNPIGLSAVRLNGLIREAGSLLLRIAGVDFLDQTPVLDIKPYLPYADSLPSASGGFAQTPPGRDFEVVFSAAAEAACRRFSSRLPQLRALVTGILKGDPRPGYYHEKPVKRDFGMRLYDLDVRWECAGDTVTVLSIETFRGKEDP
jgi:tRNA-Thr(GGU) m(6)t(6)A37 methyltransferase TsaA